MSTTEILNQLPHLKPEERRAILRRIYELEEERAELEWAAHAADVAFQELDRLEEEHASARSR